MKRPPLDLINCNSKVSEAGKKRFSVISSKMVTGIWFHSKNVWMPSRFNRQGAPRAKLILGFSGRIFDIWIHAKRYENFQLLLHEDEVDDFITKVWQQHQDLPQLQGHAIFFTIRNNLNSWPWKWENEALSYSSQQHCVVASIQKMSNSACFLERVIWSNAADPIINILVCLWKVSSDQC